MMNRFTNVLNYLENSAEQFPEKVAVADDKEKFSYFALREKSKKIGSYLLKEVSPRTPVAVFGEKSAAMLAVFLGCVYAGCFYVPINPRHPKERRDKILKKLDNPLIISDEKYMDSVKDYEGKVVSFSDCLAEIDEKALEKVALTHIDVDPLYVMFTSGSTGEPKGIAVSHRSVIDFIEEFSKLFGFNADDVFGNQAPFDFDVSVKDIYTSLKCGATLEIIPRQKFSFPTYLIDHLSERKITVLIWAVSALCILSTLNAFTYKVPETVKKVLFSGEAMPISQLNVWKSVYPEAMFVNLYGPTEITCNCTYYVLEKGAFEKKVLPIGKPFPNERVFLLSETGEEVRETGALGEICVSGTALSLGYYGNAAETDKAFVQNPLNKNYLEKIYKTGDLGYYDEDGALCFAGRKDFQIKHMGHRIELNEIESAIQSVKDVSQAVCIFDEKEDKIYAFYRGAAKVKEIITELRKKLPAYMIPYKLQALSAFPLTENGKIDRKKLKGEIAV